VACDRLKRSPSVPVSRRVRWRLVHELRRQGVAGVPRVMRMERIARTARTSRFRRTSPFSRRMRAQRTPRGSRGSRIQRTSRGSRTSRIQRTSRGSRTSRYSLTSRFSSAPRYTRTSRPLALWSHLAVSRNSVRAAHTRDGRATAPADGLQGRVFGSASGFLDVISRSSTYRPSPPHLRQTHLHHTSCHRLHDLAHRHRPP